VNYLSALKKLQRRDTPSAKSAKRAFDTYGTTLPARSKLFLPPDDGDFVGPPAPHWTGPNAPWRPYAAAFYNHITACRECYAPRGRYCLEGSRLRDAYYERKIR